MTPARHVLQLRGRNVTLRPAQHRDVERLVAIRSLPEVRSRWRGDDLQAEIAADVDDGELHLLVIEAPPGSVIGAIQWAAHDDPDYAHASVDLFIDPAVHGRGLGADAVRTLCRHLLDVEGFHRLVIDPAANNVAAIRCYEKVGFQRVGVMRAYERGSDGTWHDGLLMDLLRPDFADDLIEG